MNIMEFNFSVIGGLLILATGLASTGLSLIIGVISVIMGLGIIISITLAARHEFPWRVYVFTFAIISLILGQGLMIGPVAAALATLIKTKNMFFPTTYGAQLFAYRHLLKKAKN